MEQILGSSLAVFVGLTVVLFGFAAFMTGQGRANAWRPARQVVIYTLLLGLADRFLVFALFDGPLLSLSGYLVHTAALLAIGLAAYRLTKVRRMICQYPWLYERAGLFAWRDRSAA